MLKMKLILITLVAVVVGMMVGCGEPAVIPETRAEAIAYVKAALNERETVGTPGENCLEGMEAVAKEYDLPYPIVQARWGAERSYHTGWIWRVSSGRYEWHIFDKAKGGAGRYHGKVSSGYPYTPC